MKRASIAALALCLVACGASQRERAVRTGFSAFQVAAAGFATWDKEHQRQIVAEAQTYVDGQMALGAYRAKRAPVILGLNIATSAISLAALDPTIANVAAAAVEVRRLYDSMRALRGDP